VDEPRDGRIYKGPHKVVLLRANDGTEEAFVNMPPDTSLKPGDDVFMEFEASSPGSDIRVLRWFSWFGPHGQVMKTDVPRRLQGSPAPEPPDEYGGAQPT
jgi:hypothetical protein